MKVPKAKGTAIIKNNMLFIFADDFILEPNTPMRVLVEDDSFGVAYWDGSKWVPVGLVPVDDLDNNDIPT